MKVFYREHGQGEVPVVLLHGVFGSSVNWQTIGRGLADGRRVVAVDLRNHGRSPHHPSITYPEMVGDVLELFDDLALEQASVLGHSMGGKVAMALALRHGHRVHKLVVADMAPVAFTFRPSVILEALAGIDLDVLESRNDADRALAADIPDRRVRAFLLQNLVREDGRFHWRINLEALRHHSPDLADFQQEYLDSTYDGPTLFLRGEHSDYVRPEHEPRIYELFPQARVKTLEGTGHWLHAEAPERFTATVAEFLNNGG